MTNNNYNKYSNTTFVLGLLSLIPFFGFILGIIALIYGFKSLKRIKLNNEGGKNKTIAGISISIISILLWGGLYTFMKQDLNRKINDGTFERLEIQGVETQLINYVGKIELYYKSHGNYPDSLGQLDFNEFELHDDLFGYKIYYKKLDTIYDIRSLGKDGLYGTEDDIFPK